MSVEVNPVRHQLHLGPCDHLRTLLLGLLLLPLRLLGLLLCFSLGWLVSSVALVGGDMARPLAGWRAGARAAVGALGRLSMACCGFHWVQVGGRVGQAR